MLTVARAPIGRKRQKDFDLPPRMVRRHGARGDRYYYVTHDRRWIPLGSDLDQARRLWADYECIGQVVTVEGLLDRYRADCLKDQAPGGTYDFIGIATATIL